jgi:hypothetical protein
MELSSAVLVVVGAVGWDVVCLLACLLGCPRGCLSAWLPVCLPGAAVGLWVCVRQVVGCVTNCLC